MNIDSLLRALHPLLILSCVCQQAVGMRVRVSPAGEGSSPEGGFVHTQLEGTVSLSCEVEGGQTEEELQWTREGALVNLGQGNRLNVSRLCVQNMSKDDHLVTFTCLLKRDPDVKASVMLNVHFPPVLSGTDEVTVEEFSEVKLSCDVHANPAVSVVWTRNGENLDLVGSGYTLYQDGREARVTIAKALRDVHPGLYSCVTNSTEYGQSTKSFQLTVEEMVMGIPTAPIIAGVVVILCTAVLAVVSRWNRITQCCK